MIRFVGLSLLVGATALPAQAAPRPHGKVVRVERARGVAAVPRVCDMQADRTGMCLGTEPAVGEVISVLDDTGLLAEARITEAGAFVTGMGTASCNALWRIKTEVVRGDLTAIPMHTIGLVDPEIQPRKSRMFPQSSPPPHPTGSTTEKVVAAVDRDGDGTADVLLTQSSCDDGSGTIGTGMCIDEWSRVKGKLTRVQQTNFATCGF